MKTKTIFILLCGFTLTGLMINLAYAEDYYSQATPPNGGYYSTGSTNSNSNYYSSSGSNSSPSNHHSHRSHNRDKFSISVNLGNPVPPPAPTFIVTNPSYQPRYLKWVDMAQGYPLPMNAVIGGMQPYPRATLYVCRAFYQNGLYPGKLFNGTCNIAWGGNEIVMTEYQVLINRGSLNWVGANHGYVPPNAIQGGDYNRGNPLYICQINYRGGTHPGRLSGRECHVGWGGSEVMSPYYNVLVG